VRELPAVLDPADPSPAVQTALRDWLALQHAFALRPQQVVPCLREHGDPRRALAEQRGRAPDAASLERQLAQLRADRVVALPLASSAFPPGLARLDDAPLLLLVQGDLEALRAPCVAIVGSRAPSIHGRVVAERFAAEIARAGACVVSGLAIGIDSVAHRAALAAGGRTLAVQACGPDRVYPARHRELAGQVAARGALLSELPPGTPALRPHFPFRNRLISALALCVLVVEARLRSGSLVTARHAADQGIDVWAVPGPLGTPVCEGTNRLLRDGAHVALEPDDLLRPLGLEAPPHARVQREARTAEAPPGGVARVLRALQGAPATVDELAQRLGRAPEALAPELLELELAGRIGTDRDGRLRALPAPPR